VAQPPLDLALEQRIDGASPRRGLPRVVEQRAEVAAAAPSTEPDRGVDYPAERGRETWGYGEMAFVRPTRAAGRQHRGWLELIDAG
jgi:hypothetical protein